jgi:hypothetical protein
LEEKLKHLMEELGIAINDSLRESPSVAHALSEIREAGYDIFLILEATIGFQKQDGIHPAVQPEDQATHGELVLNAGDAEFLQSLKIRLDPIQGSPKREV